MKWLIVVMAACNTAPVAQPDATTQDPDVARQCANWSRWSAPTQFAAFADTQPALTADRLQLFYQTPTGIAFATRARTDGLFIQQLKSPIMAATVDDMDPSVSADGLTWS